MSGFSLRYDFCYRMVKQSRLPSLSDVLSNCAWLVILLCASHPVRAQYRYDVWTADTGLPQNIVRGVYQAPHGFLWIATFDGLVSFDGVHFTVFNKSNTPGLTTNRIGSMQSTPDGDLWLGTE